MVVINISYDSKSPLSGGDVVDGVIEGCYDWGMIEGWLRDDMMVWFDGVIW